MSRASMVNVLIKDGNRTVSWEHSIKETIGYTLKVHGFDVKNLMAINFRRCDGGDYERMKLKDCGLTKYNDIVRVFFILMKEEKEGEKNDG